MKKSCIEVLLGFMFVCIISTMAFVTTALAADVDATDYSYTITPLLEPFNEYFFVKTDNPDPTSFRFADKSSKYSDEACIEAEWDFVEWEDIFTLYADVKYENKKTGRISGGYIFSSYNTDGGKIVLQTRNESYYGWDVTWSDTTIKYTLPALMDDVDYLIDMYGTKSNFFDNMDAIEEGFSSICIYSGSHIRGEIYKGAGFWGLSNSPHKDQRFYIQSPYGRKDSKKLFASVIYPYRYDSLGFPSVMGKVAERLDSTITWEWHEDYHSIINVTYKGKTREYGGCGYGEGQGITEDKIKKYFTFGTNATNITLENSRELLDYYASLEISDDVPRDNALTWERVCEKVCNGSWVRLIDIYNVYGGSGTGYTYLYKKGEGKEFESDSVGSTGAEIYYYGDLGYASDAWVDGRYVNSWEVLVPGEKFEDHPTSSIILKNVTVPQIKCYYAYNDKGEFVYHSFEIVEKEKEVCTFYYSEDNKWIVEYRVFDENCADYSQIVELVEGGYIDKKYLDMVTLTLDEVKKLKVDRNTNKDLEDYLIYDGLAKPGTSLKDHKHRYIKEITRESTYTKEGLETHTCKVCLDSYTRTIPKKVSNFTYSSRTSSTATLKWSKNTSADGYEIWQYKSGKWSKIKTITSNTTTSYKVTGLKSTSKYNFKIRAYKKYGDTKVYSAYVTKSVKSLPTTVKGFTFSGRTASTVTLKWTKNTSADGYVIQQYKSGKWTTIKTISSKSTVKYKITGLKPSKTYKFRIRAYKKDGSTKIYGTTYSEKSVKTLPSAVKGFTYKTRTTKTITLKWYKNTSADGYVIQQYKGGKWVTIKTITKNSTVNYKVTGLKKDTSYKFRIKTYKKAGSKKLYSASYTNKTVKTLAK